MKSSISTRSAICRDLLKRNSWDLFLTTFTDTHSTGHNFWHLSEATNHPLYPYKGKKGFDPLLESFQNVDRAIGEMLAEVPENTYILCYAVHGMGNNVTDLYSMAFLPELMYRYNFPDKVGIAPGKLGFPSPPMITKPLGKTWAGVVWRKKYEPNPIKRFFRQWMPSKYLKSEPQSGWMSPYELDRDSDLLSRMPAQWCSSLWPQMKAFAIPSFSDGNIRINLQGRERDGIVPPSEYEALCDELTELISGLKNARTGELLVKDVIRTRRSAAEKDCSALPDADLIVKWQEEHPADVVDSPQLGRIGPLPYYRTGSHRSSGFLLAKGPGIVPGSDLHAAHIVDVAPTILNLIGAPIPEYFDGKPLLEVSAPNTTVAI
ncbi:MAG: hypothetical protein F6K26_31245 [Moorea sp. SIO2I5]|nr:hypothetical protein [Moorena sp. SIO2I5]